MLVTGMTVSMVQFWHLRTLPHYHVVVYFDKFRYDSEHYTSRDDSDGFLSVDFLLIVPMLKQLRSLAMQLFQCLALDKNQLAIQPHR